MELLNNLQYTKNHEWVLIEGNIATIGITDYAQKELGDIVYVDVDCLEQQLNADDVFGSVEAVKTVSDLYMPVSGKIIEVNDALDNNPDLLNQSPYNDGWIIKVQINDANNNELLNSDQYKSLIGM
ncbi:MAG: glycine cleavage system protein GcvH [Flavobacteriales bacterium TMED191]|nr:MAG: glycine cleavage system protein GcvH [Flavobacteriales bacterium TMED191]|tara:strand:- start:198 stop:575 length:378 start_codon:yes stop_codon:yes gene_type:complete